MTTSIHQEVILKGSPQKVFEALADSEKHSAFTGAPAEISREAGGAFSTHGGVLSGRILEIEPGKRIVQAWRVKGWEEGTYSVVRYELKPSGSDTLLVLDHTGFPVSEGEHLSEGWKSMYWDPLEKYLGS